MIFFKEAETNLAVQPFCGGSQKLGEAIDSVVMLPTSTVAPLTVSITLAPAIGR
jgi:hypothetical protein